MTTSQKNKIKQAFQGINRNNLASLLNKGKYKHMRNVVDQIATGGVTVSPKRALLIQRLTYGKVPASVLRPDIFE